MTMGLRIGKPDYSGNCPVDPSNIEPSKTTLNPFSLLTNYRPVLFQSQPQEDQSYIDIAVDVLQVQSQAKLNILKNFLLSLPSPTDIERVLAKAVDHLAQTDPRTYHWILQHPDYLMPELDLKMLAPQLAFSKLKNSQLILEQDFQLTSQDQLRLSPAAKTLLLAESSVEEYLLFKEILKTDFSQESE
ncbi:MAG: hypothetical protein WAN66_23820 [Limnoraphis robusta]|uniref:Uncharacterized protein n=1 Tax=Limnoraphis robusta CCNP1315 TaxID=3110306 RepID=A0ABU5U493_9CYAN|nr:hypothetical protein [Limnoraphis robusta]MEA5522009.1 hypothetical protein [Limnoraphis robusta CCNP1315]MEA5545252.1 hypothetical protein [Limnoraphis robusta CCNP1324]